MYQTEIRKSTVKKALILVEMNDKETEVNVFIRESVDASIKAQAEINIEPEEFVNLVVPILREIGCRVDGLEEVF